MPSRVQPSNRGSSFPGSNNCTKLAGGFDSSAAAKQTFLGDKVAFVQLWIWIKATEIEVDPVDTYYIYNYIDSIIL